MSVFNKYSTDGGATFLDVEDSNAVHWSENAILGAHNLNDNFNVKWATNNGGGVIVTDTGITVTCAAQQYSGAYKGNNDLRNMYGTYPALIVSFDYKSDIACNGLIGTPPQELRVTLPTDWTSYSCRIEDPSTFGYISIYNMDTTKTPTISVRNFMIKIADDTENSYNSPALPNSELTKNVYANNKFTYTYTDTDNHSVDIIFERRTDFIIVRMNSSSQIKFPTAWEYTPVNTLPRALKPRSSTYANMVVFQNMLMMKLEPDGRIGICANTGSAIWAQGTGICSLS